LAALVASSLNDTPHCLSGLRVRLATEGADADLVAKVLADPSHQPSGDQRIDAAVAYAEKLTTTPSTIAESDIDSLRAAGFDDLEILDLNNMVAYFNYVNRVANGLGLRTEIPADHALRAAPH
jgi:uncharacterized peroxidase-related enzyme